MGEPGMCPEGAGVPGTRPEGVVPVGHLGPGG